MSLTILPNRTTDNRVNPTHTARYSLSSTASQGAYRAFQSGRHDSDGTSIGSPYQQRIGLQYSTSLSANPIQKSDMEGGPQNRKPSPSHTAALLAHHRAMSSQDVRLAANKDAKGLLLPMFGTRHDAGSGIPKDDSSYTLPNTRALVKLYEAKKDKPTRTQSVRYVSRPETPLRSPVPIRPPTAFDMPPDLASQKTPTAKIEAKAPSGARPGAAAAAANLAVEQTTRSNILKRQAPEPPPPRGLVAIRQKDRPLETQIPLEETDSAINGAGDQMARVQTSDGAQAASATSTASALHPSISLPSVSSLSHQPTNRSSKASSLRPTMHVSRSVDKFERPSMPSRPSRESQQSLSQQMSVDSLANAIVASSLASSRAPSPSKPPPPTTIAPHNHRFQLFHRNHSHEQISRTPSPAKAMRQTMRDPTALEETENRHKNKSHHLHHHHHHPHHLVRKHPNKHHEGDRKRYRTQLTERERRRYEGVWAANRGLLIPANEANADASAGAGASTMVVNIVVRDIWRRSRLPEDVLEEVWDLVSVRELDRLNREEFVVGLWLIDQRLKGNKLPVKVSESVWGSVRRLEGIKIPKQKH